jgi:hypothetical protein
MEVFTCMKYSNLIRNLKMTDMRNVHIKILQSKRSQAEQGTKEERHLTYYSFRLCQFVDEGT